MNQSADQSLRSAETIPPQGAMGAVYFAWNTQLDRAVAFKVPRLTDAEDSDIVHRLLREAKKAASLDHPHICRVYDVGSESGTSSSGWNPAFTKR